MSGALKKSLAAWCEEHEMVILCIRSPQGEHFVVDSPDGAIASLGRKVGPISEQDARERLARLGLSGAEIDEAVDLARDWATTVTGGLAATLSRS